MAVLSHFSGRYFVPHAVTHKFLYHRQDAYLFDEQILHCWCRRRLSLAIARLEHISLYQTLADYRSLIFCFLYKQVATKRLWAGSLKLSQDREHLAQLGIAATVVQRAYKVGKRGGHGRD